MGEDTFANPVIGRRGVQIFIHHYQVFTTLERIHPATEDQLLTQYCEDHFTNDVETADQLSELCGRLSGCVADLIEANIIVSHGDLLRPA